MDLAARYADLQFSTRRTISSIQQHRATLDKKLAAFGRTARLTVADIAGVAYNPFARSFRIVDDTSVNYIMAFRRPRDD